MAKISEAQAYARFQQLGRNSSHFVWFLTQLDFFETSNGWIFGYLVKNGVTIFALEPLMPIEPVQGPGDFDIAWREVESVLQPKISFFVSVYDDFLTHLKRHAFQALHVGREPFVLLAHCIPTGKSGKGVRAARNQALRAGLHVEEWSKDRIDSHPTMRQDMARVLEQWRRRKLIKLDGFLNTVDPFHKMELRRFFVATSRHGQLEGFLVATPIPGRNSFFLEDLVLRSNVARGAGELLTLEAMATLAESSAEYASLGVVSLTSITPKSAYQMPPLASFVLVSLPKYLAKIYNVGGMETFRKRFKPQHWENVHLSLRNYPGSGLSDSRAWFRALWAMICCFRPRLNLSWELPYQFVLKEFVKHPVSTLTCGLAALSFTLVNQGGRIPDWALRRFGFSGDSPVWEWPLRSLTSDFLFFDFNHFASSFLLLFVLLRWMERSYPVRFVAAIIVATSFFDDFVNQLVLIAPYSYFHPRLFEHLVTIKDVGPSLWVAIALGLQLYTLRRYREIIFSVVSMGIVLAFAFSASHLSTLILNLNHSLFFALGFIIGQLRYEHERKISRSVARQKPPVAKSVSTAPNPQRHA